MAIHLNPQQRAVRMPHRPWWVCCYGFEPYIARGQWVLHRNKFYGGQRRWQLIDLKTFPTCEDALKSRSLGKKYHPFNHPYAFVVLRERTTASLTHITEHQLYAEPEVPNDEG